MTTDDGNFSDSPRARIADLVTALIDADMREYGFYPISYGDAQYVPSTAPSGYYRQNFYPGSLGGGYTETDHAPGPFSGGTPDFPKVSGNPNVPPQEDNPEYYFNPQRDIYDKWTPLMDDPILTQWQELPSPSSFEPALTALTTAMQELAISPAINPNGQGGDNEGDMVDFQLSPAPQGQLSTTFNTVASTISNYEGSTVRAFYDNYVTEIPTKAHNLFLAVLLAKRAVAAEQEMWKRTNTDFQSIMHDAVGRAGQINDGGLDFQALGNVLTVIGTIGSVVGIVPGPQKAVVSGASTVFRVLGQLLSSSDKETNDTGGFDADSTDGLWSQVQDRLTKLHADVDTTEGDVKSALNAGSDLLAGSKAEFDLQMVDKDTGAGGYGSGNGVSDVEEFLDTTDPNQITFGLAVNPDILEKLGNEHVKLGLAGHFSRAAAALDDYSEGEWSRDGSIGIGPSGYLPELGTFVRHVRRLLSETSLDLIDVGEVLAAAAGALRGEEQAARDAMTTLASEHDLAESGRQEEYRNQDELWARIRAGRGPI